jgi:hypothetical protein
MVMLEGTGVLCTRRSRELAVQHVGSETLVYDEARHQAFCLNPVASSVWLLADGKRSVAEIATAATLALARPVSAELALFTLGELERDGLLLPSPAATTAPILQDLSRRNLLRNLTAGAVVMLPAIAVIMAPKAAQAYNGCVNCNSQQTTGSAYVMRQRAARERGIEEEQEQQQQRRRQLDSNSY